MRNLFLWYLPQTGFFGLGMYASYASLGPTEPFNFAGATLVGAMLAAAYTGGVNLVLSLLARLKRNRRQSRGSVDISR